MSTENIVEINHRIEAAKRLRQKFDAWRAANEQWIATMLDLAHELHIARLMHNSDQAFSVWLVENGLDEIGKNDRAALIAMGSHVLSVEIIDETGLRSPELIWRKIRSKVVSDQSETDPIRTPLPEINETHLSAANFTDPPAQSGVQKVRTPPDKVVKAALSSQHPFYKWPRADEVTAIYLNPDARTLIGHAIKERGGRDVWNLILSVIDAGLLIPTNTSFRNINLRALFPSARLNYAAKFDLTKPKDRTEIRRKILPAAIFSKESLASGMDLESIVADYAAKEIASQRAAVAAERLDKQLKTMPADQQEVIMYGERLWPLESALYNYHELRSAIWLFRDLDIWISPDQDVESRMIRIRFLVGHYSDFARHELEGEARARIENLSAVVKKLSRLVVKNPDGECKFPPPPKREDEW